MATAITTGLLVGSLAVFAAGLITLTLLELVMFALLFTWLATLSHEVHGKLRRYRR